MSTDLGLTLQDVALIHRYSGIQEKEVLLPVSQSDEQSRQLIDGGREEAVSYTHLTLPTMAVV